MIKNIASSSIKRVVTFPGQGKLISAELVSSLDQLCDISKFKASLSSQISSNFTDSLFSLHDHPNFLLQSSNLQPAIVSISLLYLDILKKNNVELKPNYAIGHSLGELTALLLNNVLDQEYGALIAHKRGLFMEQAIDNSQSYGMSAIISSPKAPVSESVIKDVLSNYKTVSIANQNLPSQTVLSGETNELKSSLKDIADLNKKSRIKIIPLKVKIPFHNELLKESKFKFREFIETSFPKIDNNKKLNVPIISNLTGKIVTTHGEALDNFIEDFTNPVLFSNSIQTLLAESEDEFEFINIGPNANVIQGLTRSLDNGNVATSLKVETMDDISLLKSFHKVTDN